MLKIYVVEPGDTLTSVARSFGVTVQSLLDLNEPPYPDRLTPGQALLIPSKEEEPPTYQRYTVQPGDTLWRIAQRFGTTVEAIVQLNNISDPSLIFPGQVLLIPVTTPPPAVRQYTVQPGDTLWRIAQRFGVTIEEIVRLNNISDPNRIIPGQVLLIPAAPTPGPQQYTVQPGDTLWRIAQRFGTTVEAIAALNNITDPNRIFPGQVLLIPSALPVPPPQPTPPPVTPKYRAIVNGYLISQGAGDRQLLLATETALTYVSVFSYAFRPGGELTGLNDFTALQTARELGIGPLMTLTNIDETGFSTELAHRMLTNLAEQQVLIDRILDVMLTKGYIGLNVDLEYVLPEDREAYNDFMRRLRDVLQPRGLSLSSALAPKISANQPGLLYEAHDYPAHGEIADFVIIMTYEWGWSGGPPLAISPISEVRRVLDYAVTAIPRDKLLMSAPLYGRDWRIPWQSGTRARTFSVQDAIRLAIDRGVPIQYNTLYQSPFYRYVDETGQEHEVWFEDPRSLDVKIETLKEYNLAGISFWNLINSFPQAWPLLKDRLDIVKVQTQID
jgi:spore germination protein